MAVQFVELHKHPQQKITVTENEEKVIVLVGQGSFDAQVSVEMTGAHARSIILGLFVCSEKDVIKLHTQQLHTHGDTLSDLHVKTILFDRSVSSYHGDICIEPKAQRSNAYQRDDNLMMSQSARADSEPSLEILANDVRCTHGATIGKLDEEQLLYVRSRGIAVQAAREMLLSAFFHPVLARIPDEKLKIKIEHALVKKIQERSPYVV